MRRDTDELGGEKMEPAAFGDRTWVLGKARLLQKLKAKNSKRILLEYGCQIAPCTDYVAVSFCFNSGFSVPGEENDVKSGPLQ